MKTHETFNYLDCVKNLDIFLLENTKSSNTTRFILSSDILSKSISFIKIYFLTINIYHLNYSYKYIFFHKYYFELLD